MLISKRLNLLKFTGMKSWDQANCIIQNRNRSKVHINEFEFLCVTYSGVNYRTGDTGIWL